MIDLNEFNSVYRAYILRSALGLHWREFHDKHATLVGLCAKCNGSLALCKELLKLIYYEKGKRSIHRAVEHAVMRQQALACEQREKARRSRDYYVFFLSPFNSTLTPVPRLELF
jgi:hypothetical protein